MREADRDERAATLVAAVRAALESLDAAPGPALAAVARAIAERPGDGCGLHLLAPPAGPAGDEAIPDVGWHPDPALGPLLGTLLAAENRPGFDGLVGRVARGGRAVRLPRVTPEGLRVFVPPAAWPAVARVGIHSALLLPLAAFGRTLGVLTAVRDRTTAAYSAADEALLGTVADEVGQALDRALLARAAGQAMWAVERERLGHAFVAGLTHELRTPLGAAELALGLLADGAAGPLAPDAGELVDVARRNTKRLALLVEDLMAAHQLDAGTLAIRTAPLDLRDVVADAATAVAPLLAEKRQALAIDLPSPLPVRGDARRLGQVVTNLLANAHRHTPPGTRVAITTRRAAEVRLIVADAGPGIPPGDLERIFARHHGRRAGGGAGLGLALVREFVERHGGRVWAEDAPEGGAAFHIALPRDGQDPPR